MSSWAWMSGCRHSHQWLLMGQSVDLSVLGTWGIIACFCQHGRERAVGYPDIMQLAKSPDTGFVFHGYLQQLATQLLLPFDLEHGDLNTWRVFFPLQWPWRSWESIQEKSATTSYQNGCFHFLNNLACCWFSSPNMLPEHWYSAIMLWVSTWLVLLLYLFNSNMLILVIISPNKGWTYHKYTVNIVLPILEISFQCWAAPPAFAELFSQSQTWRSKGSCLCHQWQYLTTQKVMPDVTPTLQSHFMCPIVCRKRRFWLRKSACICAAPESTAAVPRYIHLAKMERLWWWVWWQVRGILYEIFKAVGYFKDRSMIPLPYSLQWNRAGSLQSTGEWESGMQYNLGY